MSDRGALAILGWASSCLLVLGLPDASRAAPPTEAAAVHVDSCPPGANVYLDESLKGRTPLELRDLAIGPHRITLTLEGHSGRAIPFEAVAGSRKELVVPLAPGPLSDAAGRGMQGLFVVACPVDATLFVDETPVGQGSAYLPDLPAGPHTVLAVRPGYAVREEVATVSPGATRTLEVLLPQSREGTAVSDTRLLVESCPEDAGVVVDGRWRGTTPVELDVSPGRHRVALALPHHLGRHEIVSVPAGGRRELKLPLHAIATSSPGTQAARLSIATCPIGLGLWVDGAQTGKSPLVVTVGPGPHQVGIQANLKQPGYSQQPVVVQPGETLSVEHVLPLAESAERRKK